MAVLLHVQIMTNAMTLMGQTLDPLGMCLDLLVSCINHSCDPNVFLVMDGRTISARCLRKIEEGDELTISYVENTNPTTIRQKELKQKFFFDCRCAKCLNEGSILEDRFEGTSSKDPSALKIQDEAFDILRSVRSGKITADETVPRLRKALELCRRSDAFPLERQPIPSISNDLSVELLGKGHHKEAFVYLFSIYTKMDPKWHANFHPARLAHTYVLARLLKYFGFHPEHTPSSLQGTDVHLVHYGLLLEIESHLNRSHGATHSFAKGVRAEVMSLRADLTHDVMIAIHRDLPSIMSSFRRLSC